MPKIPAQYDLIRIIRPRADGTATVYTYSVPRKRSKHLVPYLTDTAGRAHALTPTEWYRIFSAGPWNGAVTALERSLDRTVKMKVKR